MALIRRVSLVCAIALGGLGCELLVGIEPLSGPEGCWDPSGFDGRGCFRVSAACHPGAHEEIINACTPSPCLFFDNAARGVPDGKLSSGGAGGAGGTMPMSGGAGGGGAMPCSALDLPNPVYVTGSDSIVPIFEQIGPTIADELQIVYLPQRSCDGVQAIIQSASIEGEAIVWHDKGAAMPTLCHLDPTPPHIGISDVFAETCADGLQLSDEIDDRQGPIQAAFFGMPQTSNDEQAISAEAAYRIYGFGSDSGVEPWTDEAVLYRRPNESGTQNLIASYIGVPRDRFKGKVFETAAEMRVALETPEQGSEGKTLGILAVPDDTMMDIRRLALQGFGQRCAFAPGLGGKDLSNVRDGHYLVWGPLHLFVRKDDKSKAGQLISYVQTEYPLPNGGARALLEKIIDAGFVPPCAMKVARKNEAGSLSPYAPKSPCHCFYDEHVGRTPSCAECASNDECGATESCNFGFCEPAP